MPRSNPRFKVQAGRLLRLPAEALVLVFVLLDNLVAPLFRPIMRALSRLRLVQRLEALIAGLPPYAILVLLVVPFAVAEVAKAYALVLMAQEHFITGIGLFIGAYVVSILVCERIFHAGRAPLMTIGWFRRAFDWVMALKARVFEIVRATAVWRAARQMKEQLAERLNAVRSRLTRWRISGRRI